VRGELLRSESPRPKAKPKTDAVDRQQLNQLSVDTFTAISDWYHYAILNMTLLARRRLDAAVIARELGCAHQEAQEAIDRLKRLGLLEERDGRLRRTQFNLRSGTDFDMSAGRRLHLQLLQKAKQSLLTDPIGERNFSSMTMAIDSRLLPEAKRRLSEFVNELTVFLESGRPDRVYTLTTNLFPLNRPRKG
jgi:uncharacterized protein (TIGR02147 family)